MHIPQIIRFADYLKDGGTESVRTVLHHDHHDNMVLWQIPPGTSLPAHRHPHGVDIWIVLQGEAELLDDENSGNSKSCSKASSSACTRYTARATGRMPKRTASLFPLSAPAQALKPHRSSTPNLFRRP